MNFVTECVYDFLIILEIYTHFSLNSINWQVFLMETDCFLCVTGTEVCVQVYCGGI